MIETIMKTLLPAIAIAIITAGMVWYESYVTIAFGMIMKTLIPAIVTAMMTPTTMIGTMILETLLSDIVALEPYLPTIVTAYLITIIMIGTMMLQTIVLPILWYGSYVALAIGCTQEFLLGLDKMIVQPTVRFFLTGITMVQDSVAIGRAGLSSPVLPRVGLFATQLFQAAWTGVVGYQFFGRATKHCSIRAHIVLRFQHHRNAYSQQYQCERGWKGAKSTSQSKSKSHSKSEQWNFPLSVFRFVILTMMTTLRLRQRLRIACTEGLVMLSVVVVFSFVSLSLLVVVAFVGVLVVVVVAFVAMAVVAVVSFVAMAVAIRFHVQKSGVVFTELWRFLVFLVEKSGEAKRTANNVTDDEEDDAIPKSSSSTPKAAPSVQPPTAKEVERNQAVDYVLAHPKDEWFRVLGVDGSVDDKMLKKHYREKSMLCHSDKHVGLHAHPRANRAQQIVNEAYDELKDLNPEKRKQKYASEQRKHNGNGSRHPPGANTSNTGKKSRSQAKEPQQETPFARSSCHKNNFRRPAGTYSSSSGRSGTKAKKPKSKPAKKRPKTTQSPPTMNWFILFLVEKSGVVFVELCRFIVLLVEWFIFVLLKWFILFLVNSSVVFAGVCCRSILAVAKWFTWTVVTMIVTFYAIVTKICAWVQSLWVRRQQEKEEAKVAAVAAKKDEERKAAVAVAASIEKEKDANAAAAAAQKDEEVKSAAAADKKDAETKAKAVAAAAAFMKKQQQEQQAAKTKAATAAAHQIKKDRDDAKQKAEVTLQKKQHEENEAADAAADAAAEAEAAATAKAKQEEAAAKEQKHRRHTRGVIDDDSVLGSAYVDGRRQSRRCLGLKPLGTIRLECGTRRSARIRAGRNS